MECPKKILLVDDDELTRELMQRTLARQGYEVTVAEDGLRAFELAESLRPDLIITDLFMPSADGAHLIRRVRAKDELMATPILVTTGYGSGGAALTLSQGANAYEPKPVDPDSLLATVRRLLA